MVIKEKKNRNPSVYSLHQTSHEPQIPTTTGKRKTGAHYVKFVPFS